MIPYEWIFLGAIAYLVVSIIRRARRARVESARQSIDAVWSSVFGADGNGRTWIRCAVPVGVRRTECPLPSGHDGTHAVTTAQLDEAGYVRPPF